MRGHPRHRIPGQRARDRAAARHPHIYGKTLRLKDDGTAPSDNPFVGKAGHRPEIYTIGHRDHFGIAPHPVSGQIFHAELGPMGGDKINILKAGGNYGWPTYGYGRENNGSPMQHPNREGIEPAWITWNPGHRARPRLPRCRRASRRGPAGGRTAACRWRCGLPRTSR